MSSEFIEECDTFICLKDGESPETVNIQDADNIHLVWRFNDEAKLVGLFLTGVSKFETEAFDKMLAKGISP